MLSCLHKMEFFGSKNEITVSLTGVFNFANEYRLTPAPVCANMIQTLMHTCRGQGCFIFIETNVKRQSNPLLLKVLNIQHRSAHIQPSTTISKYHFKKCVPFRHNSRGN